ncbi:MAG: cytochrome ubiquinol oxidase subunit I [Alphaproteobacteria bacterium]|nr:cytochrome ubiquinol oxidase subunit I [Alphaproteobacteria bacterium]
MHGFEAAELARIQFAFTVSFHILFPAFTIGLASYLAVLEGLYLWTGRAEFRRLFRFWAAIFAVTFGMGVVSGVVMSYQFGTNWSRFADATGDILGPLLGYEVLTAFFREAGVLGVMLFGWDRVGRGLHFFATCMVALGTLISSFWILAANSWMHTPAGYAMRAGRFVPADWFAVIFNPSFPYRLAHMVLAAYLTTAFVVGATGASHLLRDPYNQPARVMFSMAMWMAALVAPIQLVAGDLHGLNTLEHQPAKIAAMEGHWNTERGMPLYLFGWPDMAREETRWVLAIPHAGALILTHDWNGEVKGLKDWPADQRPHSTTLFWSFRVMVGLGTLMILVGLVSLWLRRRRELYHARWFLRGCVAMGPAGFVALIAGWVTTEMGRQPWLVYGQMRTLDGLSPVLPGNVALSLALFVAVYCAVFGAGVFYLLRLMAAGPDHVAPPATPQGEAAGMRPLAAAPAEPAP